MEKKRGSLERPFRMKAFWRKAKTFREAMLSPWLSRWGRRLLAGGAVYVFSCWARNWSFFPVDESSVGVCHEQFLKLLLQSKRSWDFRLPEVGA